MFAASDRDHSSPAADADCQAHRRADRSISPAIEAIYKWLSFLLISAS